MGTRQAAGRVFDGKCSRACLIWRSVSLCRTLRVDQGKHTMGWLLKSLPAVAAVLFVSVSSATPALAEFTAITSRSQFEQVISGRELRRFGIRLTVTTQGDIVGRAFGNDVTGAWTWQDGFFCRDLFWADDDLGYNCQLVELNGDTLRFTTDRGAGIYADLTLR